MNTINDKLADALRNVVNMLRDHPAMQGREYISLGVAANNALREYDASLAAPPAQGEWVRVPREIVDRFPEINPSNYGHDDVCKLNSWGVELVLAAAPQPAPELFPGTHAALDALTIREQPAPAPVQVECSASPNGKHAECDEAGTAGWCEWCSEQIAHPPAPAADGAGELRSCKGTNCNAAAANDYKHSSECLFEHARAVASGIASVSVGATVDPSIDFIEWRGQRIDLAAAIAALRQPVPDAVRELREIGSAIVKSLGQLVSAPQTDEQCEAEVIPRAFVIDQVMRILDQFYKLRAIISELQQEARGNGE